jgi:hypothetical protein
VSASPERALVAALRAAFQASATVRTLLGDPVRVADGPDAGGTFPFLTFGDHRAEDAGAAMASATAHALSLHVWSRYAGRAEALELIAALRGVIEGGAVAPAGHRLVLLHVAYTDVFRAADGRTMHGLLRLKAVTEPS